MPTLSELYGVSGVVRGNTALIPESGVSLEAGARSTRALTNALGGLSLDCFAFVRWSNDLISYQRSAIGYVRPFNIGAARVTGLELQAAYTPRALLARSSSQRPCSIRATPLRCARETICCRTSRKWRSRLAPSSVSTSRAPWSTSAKASASYFYESSRYADRAGLIVVPGQGSLDLGAELRVQAGAPRYQRAARERARTNPLRFDRISAARKSSVLGNGDRMAMKPWFGLGVCVTFLALAARRRPRARGAFSWTRAAARARRPTRSRIATTRRRTSARYHPREWSYRRP